MKLKTIFGAVGATAALCVAFVACGSDSQNAAGNDAGEDGASFVNPDGNTIVTPNGDSGFFVNEAGVVVSADGSATDASKHATGACGGATPATGFISSVTVTVSGAPRTYAITVPTNYDSSTLYPLIIGFHGDGGTGAGYRGEFAIEAQGGNNAIFVWPNGTNNNDGHSFDQEDDPPKNPDVVFFDALMTQLQANYCVDTTRVFIHGFSGGAYFVNQLARWRQTVVKAVAAQSGGGPYGNMDSDFDNDGNLTIPGPTPAFMVHGAADTTVDPSEGQKSLTYWRAADQCTAGQTATTPTPCEKQNGGVDGVTFCLIPGMNHTVWTGAPAAIWNFFASVK